MGKPGYGFRGWDEAIKAALLCDRRAWDAIIHAYHDTVSGHVRIRGASTAESEDIAQATWLRLWWKVKNALLLELVVPALPKHQAMFLLLSYWRKGKDILLDTDDDGVGTSGGKATGAEDQVLIEEIRAYVRKHSERDYYIYVNFIEMEASAAEVATALGITVQRVRQRACELRKLIHSYTEEPDREPLTIPNAQNALEFP